MNQYVEIIYSFFLVLLLLYVHFNSFNHNTNLSIPASILCISTNENLRQYKSKHLNDNPGSVTKFNSFNNTKANCESFCILFEANSMV